jgi:hypothetical protein
MFYALMLFVLMSIGPRDNRDKPPVRPVGPAFPVTLQK